MWAWLQKFLGRRKPHSSRFPEPDTEDDPAMVRVRPTGGRKPNGCGDDQSSTGPAEAETFVGRTTGQDLGYTDETGAERRSEE